MWLGRKCCLPAAPIQPVLGTTGGEVFGQLLSQCGLRPLSLEDCEREEETDDLAAAQAVFDDQPVAYGDRKIQRRPGT